MIQTRYYSLEHWNMTDFGKNLASLRKERNLTQQDLADFLGVQPRLVGRWEQGQGKPNFDYLIKLADILEVSLDLLLRGSSNLKKESFDIKNKKLKELCKQVDHLKKEDQDVICHFLGMAVRDEKLRKLMDNQNI